jgi:hypothetical protein
VLGFCSGALLFPETGRGWKKTKPPQKQQQQTNPLTAGHVRRVSEALMNALEETRNGDLDLSLPVPQAELR